MNEQITNIKFVQEVEKYPCLYNYKLAEYSRKDITEKAWTAVGKVVNLTASQCKEKWKNLRAVFVRHTKPAPSGSSAKKKKPYYLTDCMQFTIPFIRTLNANVSGNIPNIPQEVIAQMTDDECYEEAGDSPANPSPTPISCPLSILSPSSDLPPSPMSCPLPTASTSSVFSSSPMSCPLPSPSPQSTDSGFKDRRSRKRKQQTDVDEGIMEYFQTRKAKLEKKAEDDPKRMFLLSLLPDVNAMSDHQMRTFKRRVLVLVDEILQESSSSLQNLTTQENAGRLEAQDIIMTETTQNRCGQDGNRSVLLTYYTSVPNLLNEDET